MIVVLKTATTDEEEVNDLFKKNLAEGVSKLKMLQYNVFLISTLKSHKYPYVPCDIT